MNIDLKSQFFFQSKFKAATNSLSKNVVAGFEQKKSDLNLDSENKNQLDLKKKEKKEKKDSNPYLSKKHVEKNNDNSISKVKKLMNII